ncbi:MAG: A24 family peptidase [Actinomycetota bacterium]|nr:A24 family peptidase [Actinomycetota bacterium]
MSLVTAIPVHPALLVSGALAGVLLGPFAASASVTLPDQSWPWQAGSPSWPLGHPATTRRRVVLTMATAVVLGSLSAVLGWRPATVAFLAMGIVGVMLAAVDLEHHRLPDRLTAAGAVLSASLVLADALVLGSWYRLASGLICAAVALAVFLGMALISPHGMGLGDVKLAGLLSLHTGWLSWQLALLALLAGFAVGAVASLALLLSRRATLRTAIPFGPALLVGAWAVVLALGPIH